MIEKRIEQKYIFNIKNHINFMNKNKLVKIYEERKVKSLYFDTQDFKLFQKSVFDDTEKIKIRFRTYNKTNTISKEIKFTLSTGKYKKTEITKYKNLNEIENFFYNGLYLVPVLNVVYDRNYFEFHGMRLTIDSNVTYFKARDLKNKFRIQNQFIYEIKYLDKNKSSFFVNNPIFNPVKHSKFEVGIKKLYKI